MEPPDPQLAPLPGPPNGAGRPDGRSGWRALALDLGPLRRHRDFRLLAFSRGISFFGSMITYVAVPFQVYRLTRSSLAVGAVGLVELACLLSMVFLGGALADAIDRRKLVLGGEVALAAGSIALAANASLPHPRVWPIFVAVALMAGFDALQRPSLDALMPRLVDPTELAAAASIESLEGTIGQVAGPALAGIIIAFAGLPAAYLADVLTFALSVAALAAMRAVPPPRDSAPPSVRRVVEGFAYARSRPDLLGTYAIDLLAMFFGMPSALFPAIASRYGGAGVVGLLYAAPSAGAFVVALTSGWTARIHRHGRAIAAAAVVWGAAIVVFGLGHWLWLAVAGLVLAGAADMVSGLFRTTLWNRSVPDSLRGRLASLEFVSYSAGPLLGNAEAGTAAAAFGVEASVVAGGVLCVLSVAACAAACRQLLAYDDRSG